MTLTTHALVGAAAASLFPQYPAVAFAAGFASHFAIDALPHWDYAPRSLHKDLLNPLNTDMALDGEFGRDLAVIGFDALLGFLLTLIVFGSVLQLSPAIALVGAGAALYPDLLQFLYFKIRHTRFELGLRPLQEFHIWVQKGKSIYPPAWQGLGYQALLVAAVLAVLLLLLKLPFFTS